MPSTAFSALYRQSGSDAFRPRPVGRMGNGASLYEKEYKISEMVNPDGSVTVRNRILNPDGTSRILQREYSSLDRRILGKFDSEIYEEEALPALDKSFSGSESSPTRTIWSSSDQSGQGSAFSIHRTAHPLLEHPASRAPLSPAIPKSLPQSHHDELYWTPDEGPDKDIDGRESQSSVVSIPIAESGDSDKVIGHLRPVNPVPFEAKTTIDPTVLSISTWAATETDISAISGDSMGYPALDTSTVLYEVTNEESDDDTEWSLLHDEGNIEEEPKNSTNRKKSDKFAARTSLSHPKSTSTTAQTPPDRHANRLTIPTNSASNSLEVSPSQSNLVILKQATVLAKPKPKVKYYMDPKVTGGRDLLRAQGALLDMPALVHDATNLKPTPDEQIVFTVRKKSLNDKIGVFVGISQLPSGPRLVVTKVSPNGKFAESPIEQGDIVVSINGKDFLNNPNSDEALDVVRHATDRITFVVLKASSNSATTNTSNDDFSMPSLPFHDVNEVVHPGGSKIVTKEIRNEDGSQTLLMEFFDSSGKKQKQTTRRRWISSNGSTRDISLAALSLNGELAILVKKNSRNEMVGLKLERKRSHRGQDALVVSQVFPSGLFARTPLSVGDQILAINGVDFGARPDTAEAASIFAKAEEDIMIRAWKSREWIERRQRRIAQTRQLVETFTIPAPKATAYEFDDSSYGGSMIGYNSAKKLTLKNFTASERLGFSVKSQQTHWGTVLVANGITPSSRLAAAGLQNGDVILTINGFDLRDESDTSIALSLIQQSDRSIEIEYQRLEESIEEEAAHVQTQESYKEDGTKCIRRETRNPDGSIFVKIEEIGPANAIDVSLGDRNSITGNSHSGRDGDVSQKSTKGHPFIPPTKSRGLKAAQPLFITVHKTSASQDVGIILDKSGDGIYVKQISTNGLLVGRPILPGDTILSINGHDFRTNPNVRKAQSIIAQSSKIVSFEILKNTTTRGVIDHRNDTGRKRRTFKCLCCGRRNQHMNRTITISSDPRASEHVESY